MKVIYQIVAIACMVVATSCCTMRVTSETKMTTPETEGVIADLDIRTEKLTEIYSVKIKKNEVIKLDEIKLNAVFTALHKKGADILVAPQFMVEKEACNGHTTYTVTVTGYPAYYTNFRQMSMAERMELRELKEGAQYIVVQKTAAGSDVKYGRTIVAVPVGGGDPMLNIDDTTLDRIVLKGKDAPQEPSDKADKKKENRLNVFGIGKKK